MRAFLSCLSCLLLLCAPALGDEVRLKNGAVIQGRIIREDRDSIVIDLGRGRMNIARRDIVSIRRTTSDAHGGDPSERDPAGSDDRTRMPSQDGATKRHGVPSPPVATVPRKKKERPTPTGPRVVPVEKNRPVPPRVRNGGTESTSQSRSEARAMSVPTSAPSASKPAQRRATSKPDW